MTRGDAALGAGMRCGGAKKEEVSELLRMTGSQDVYVGQFIYELLV